MAVTTGGREQKRANASQAKSSTGRRRAAAWLAVGLGLLAIAAGTRLVGPMPSQRPAAESSADPVGTPVVASPSEGRSSIDPEASWPRRPTPRQQDVQLSIWWNSPPMVARLGFVETQRQAMDVVLAETLDRRTGVQEARREAHGRFVDALIAGDETTARSAVNERNRLGSELARLDAEMKIQVFVLLDEDQRQRLAAEHPAVLRRPWLQGS